MPNSPAATTGDVPSRATALLDEPAFRSGLSTGGPDGSISRRSAQLRSKEEAASRAEQYSRGVAGGAVRGWFRGWFEADDLRRVLPFFSLAFALVAAITQPSSTGDIALMAVPVAAWSLWAFAPNVPLAAVSVAIVVPVVVAQRSGELEPFMFNVALLAFAGARWSRSLATAASLGLLAAATPVLVALAQDPMEVAVGIWVVAIAFIWVVGRVVARQERLVVELEGTRRQLAQQALQAERRRIARDVHDFVGHGLAAVMLQVTSARHVLRRDADAAEEALRSAEETGRRSMQELRRTVTLLRSEDEAGVAAPVPSASEISALVDEARAGGLAVELHMRGDLARIPPGVGLAVYRIAQEALANAARHAPRARTVLGLELTDGRVALVAETSGPLATGSSSERARPRYGLIGMRERATALGGQFTAGPTRDGWQVRCELPVQDEGSR
jgi:signal transduction histidine kinase